MKREQRLQAGRSWLAEFGGRRVVRSYGRWFGVNPYCAVIELQMLGMEFDDDYVERVKNETNKPRRPPAWKRALELQEGYGYEWDEDFAYIAGFTSGGAPYGTPRESPGDLAYDRWTQESWMRPGDDPQPPSSGQLTLDFTTARRRSTPSSSAQAPPRPIEARGPIGKKLLRAIRRGRAKKLLDFSAIAEGEHRARELRDGAAADADLDRLGPSHAYYAIAQRQLSILVELTGSLRETSALTRAINFAEDDYMPMGPPMSPLTQSYFFYWSICDLSPAGDGETLASASLDVVRDIGTNPNTLDAMEALSASRMGFWEHRGHDGDHVVLRELITEVERKCHVASGYRGHAGDIWLARVLPPPLDGCAAVVITTPYLLIESSRASWLAYLERALAAYPADTRGKVYPMLMKYGEDPRYWPEYIFEAYVNHEPDVIYLTGFPDIAASRPHAP